MIDCESEIFSKIESAVRAEYPAIEMSSEYVSVPARFPYAHIEMIDNTPVSGLRDNRPQDQFAEVTFSVNVYSNKEYGKKSEAKAILQVIDSTFLKMNFIRRAYLPVPNMQDNTIYRVTATYRAVTDGQYFYRR